jgi:glutamyl-tRNA reductase
MSILVIGVNHRSGPLRVLERVALSAGEVPKAVERLARRDNLREVVLISTCNRTEVYAVAEKFHGAYADIRDFLCELGDISADELHPHLYSHHDVAAVTHLFDVAAGLDSAVLGEAEILGQVREAWELAQREGAARTTMNLLFRQALVVGKRARTETAIARGTASISQAAVEMTSERLGGLSGRRVAVIGAGAMGEGIAVALRRSGAGDVVVVNRTPERGEALANRVEGVAVGFDRLPQVLTDTDVAITCTGSGQLVIDRQLVASAAGQRHDRPLLLVDIAVPRDVAADVAEVVGVSLLDLDDLNVWADRGRQQRRAEVDGVREIVRDEVERFLVEATALQAAPLVAALREHAESLRVRELERHSGQLGRLDPEQRELIEAITRGFVAKLLHEPSVRLRDQAGSPRGERNAAAVADLFDLG